MIDIDLAAWVKAVCKENDPRATLFVASDYFEESGDQAGEYLMLMFPEEVGSKVMIETVTLYFVGEVAEKGLGYVKLKNASWVHWTGRLSELCSTWDFTKVSSPPRRPRTEFVGNKGIALQSIVGWTEGPWVIPMESITD